MKYNMFKMLLLLFEKYMESIFFYQKGYFWWTLNMRTLVLVAKFPSAFCQTYRSSAAHMFGTWSITPSVIMKHDVILQVFLERRPCPMTHHTMKHCRYLLSDSVTIYSDTASRERKLSRGDFFNRRTYGTYQTERMIGSTVKNGFLLIRECKIHLSNRWEWWHAYEEILVPAWNDVKVYVLEFISIVSKWL